MGITEARGIITREVKYGDTSRILTVLTQELGKISVLASGVRTNKSGLLAATQLFSYVSLQLFQGRSKSLYKINSGEILEAFSPIRESLERMAYAAYFCDIANYVVQEEAPEPEQLSLLLNSLFMLSQEKAPYEQIKAVFTFRTLAIAGLLPELSICGICGRKGEISYLDLRSGCALCSVCGEKKQSGAVHTGEAVLQAAAYISLAEPKRIFSFQLPEHTLLYLSELGDCCIEHWLEHKFQTLDYLKQIKALKG